MTSRRDEIVDRYNQRISQGDHTKLTRDERAELIADFVLRLHFLQDQESIHHLCQAEIELLEKGYPKETVAKNHLPTYVKAVKEAIAAGALTLNEGTSHSYTYQKDSSLHETQEHWALSFLKYDKQTYEKFAERTTANNNLKQDDLQPVCPDAFLDKVAELLQSEDAEELAAGIAAATGRRFSEVIEAGEIEPTDDPYTIQFSGQLKKREEVGSYTAPTLLLAADVVASLERFRTLPRIQEMQGLEPKQINSHMNKAVNRVVVEHFEATGIVPVLNAEANVTIHNLRGVYGEIAVYYFCPPNQGAHRFIQQRLGHLISPTEIEKRKNSGSTEHYFHYHLVDAGGQPLAGKGVKLDKVTRPCFFKSDQLRLDAIALQLGIEGEQVYKYHRLVDWLEQQATLNIQIADDSDNQVAGESDTGSESPDIQIVSNPDASAVAELARAVSALTQQLAERSAESSQLRAENQSLYSRLEVNIQLSDRLQGQIEDLEIRNAQLQLELEQLKQQQQQLGALSGLLQALQQSGTPVPVVPVVAPEAAPPPPAAPVASALAPSVTEGESKRSRGGPRGKADEKLQKAFQAICEYNDAPGRTHEDKWAVNQNALSRLTGSNRPAIIRFIDEHRQAIDDHNLRHELGDRHNYQKGFKGVQIEQVVNV